MFASSAVCGLTRLRGRDFAIALHADLLLPVAGNKRHSSAYQNSSTSFVFVSTVFLCILFFSPVTALLCRTNKRTTHVRLRGQKEPLTPISERNFVLTNAVGGVVALKIYIKNESK